MGSPFLAGVLILAVVFGLGMFFSTWSWSKPLAAASGIVAVIATLLELGLR